MIKQARDFELSSSDYKVLEGLRDTEGWRTQKKVIENYILKLTANLVSGAELSNGSANEELARLRGFVYFWGKLSNLIEQVKAKNE